MYLLHYSIRSIISPLILAPQRAPQHASVTLSAMGFNLMNGYIMGGWLAEDPGRGVGERFGGWSWVAVAGWAVGLAGNGQCFTFMFLFFTSLAAISTSLSFSSIFPAIPLLERSTATCQSKRELTLTTPSMSFSLPSFQPVLR